MHHLLSKPSFDRLIVLICKILCRHNEKCYKFPNPVAAPIGQKHPTKHHPMCVSLSGVSLSLFSYLYFTSSVSHGASGLAITLAFK